MFFDSCQTTSPVVTGAFAGRRPKLPSPIQELSNGNESYFPMEDDKFSGDFSENGQSLSPRSVDTDTFPELPPMAGAASVRYGFS